MDCAEEPLDWLVNTKLTTHVALAEGNRAGCAMGFSPSSHGPPEVPMYKIQGMGRMKNWMEKNDFYIFMNALLKCVIPFKYEYGQPT